MSINSTLNVLKRTIYQGLSELLQDTRYHFWMLQLLGWTGWITLFAIRDVYWGQPFERISLLVVNAIAGFFLTSMLRLFYQAIWERSVLIRVTGILTGSYLIAAIWRLFITQIFLPLKNMAR